MKREKQWEERLSFMLPWWWKVALLWLEEGETRGAAVVWERSSLKLSVNFPRAAAADQWKGEKKESWLKHLSAVREVKRREDGGEKRNRERAVVCVGREKMERRRKG